MDQLQYFRLLPPDANNLFTPQRRRATATRQLRKIDNFNGWLTEVRHRIAATLDNCLLERDETDETPLPFPRSPSPEPETRPETSLRPDMHADLFESRIEPDANTQTPIDVEEGVFEFHTIATEQPNGKETERVNLEKPVISIDSDSDAEEFEPVRENDGKPVSGPTDEDVQIKQEMVEESLNRAYLPEKKEIATLEGSWEDKEEDLNVFGEEEMEEGDEEHRSPALRVSEEDLHLRYAEETYDREEAESSYHEEEEESPGIYFEGGELHGHSQDPRSYRGTVERDQYKDLEYDEDRDDVDLYDDESVSKNAYKSDEYAEGSSEYSGDERALMSDSDDDGWTVSNDIRRSSNLERIPASAGQPPKQVPAPVICIDSNSEDEEETTAVEERAVETDIQPRFSAVSDHDRSGNDDINNDSQQVRRIEEGDTSASARWRPSSLTDTRDEGVEEEEDIQFSDGSDTVNLPDRRQRVSSKTARFERNEEHDEEETDSSDGDDGTSNKGEEMMWSDEDEEDVRICDGNDVITDRIEYDEIDDSDGDASGRPVDDGNQRDEMKDVWSDDNVGEEGNGSRSFEQEMIVSEDQTVGRADQTKADEEESEQFDGAGPKSRGEDSEMLVDSEPESEQEESTIRRQFIDPDEQDNESVSSERSGASASTEPSPKQNVPLSEDPMQFEVTEAEQTTKSIVFEYAESVASDRSETPLPTEQSTDPNMTSMQHDALLDTAETEERAKLSVIDLSDSEEDDEDSVSSDRSGTAFSTGQSTENSQRNVLSHYSPPGAIGGRRVKATLLGFTGSDDESISSDRSGTSLSTEESTDPNETSLPDVLPELSSPVETGGLGEGTLFNDPDAGDNMVSSDRVPEVDMSRPADQTIEPNEVSQTEVRVEVTETQSEENSGEEIPLDEHQRTIATAVHESEIFELQSCSDDAAENEPVILEQGIVHVEDYQSKEKEWEAVEKETEDEAMETVTQDSIRVSAESFPATMDVEMIAESEVVERVELEEEFSETSTLQTTVVSVSAAESFPATMDVKMIAESEGVETVELEGEFNETSAFQTTVVSVQHIGVGEMTGGLGIAQETEEWFGKCDTEYTLAVEESTNSFGVDVEEVSRDMQDSVRTGHIETAEDVSKDVQDSVEPRHDDTVNLEQEVDKSREEEVPVFDDIAVKTGYPSGNVGVSEKESFEVEEEEITEDQNETKADRDSGVGGQIETINPKAGLIEGEDKEIVNEAENQYPINAEEHEIDDEEDLGAGELVENTVEEEDPDRLEKERFEEAEERTEGTETEGGQDVLVTDVESSTPTVAMDGNESETADGVEVDSSALDSSVEIAPFGFQRDASDESKSIGTEAQIEDDQFSGETKDTGDGLVDTSQSATLHTMDEELSEAGDDDEALYPVFADEVNTGSELDIPEATAEEKGHSEDESGDDITPILSPVLGLTPHVHSLHSGNALRWSLPVLMQGVSERIEEEETQFAENASEPSPSTPKSPVKRRSLGKQNEIVVIQSPSRGRGRKRQAEDFETDVHDSSNIESDLDNTPRKRSRSDRSTALSKRSPETVRRTRSHPASKERSRSPSQEPSVSRTEPETDSETDSNVRVLRSRKISTVSPSPKKSRK